MRNDKLYQQSFPLTRYRKFMDMDKYNSLVTFLADVLKNLFQITAIIAAATKNLGLFWF